MNRLTNALLPRGPTMTPTFNEEAPNLRAHVALRGDASSYIRAQLDVLATCRTPAHSKNAPRAGAAACVELAAALDDADVAQGLFAREAFEKGGARGGPAQTRRPGEHRAGRSEEGSHRSGRAEAVVLLVAGRGARRRQRGGGARGSGAAPSRRARAASARSRTSGGSSSCSGASVPWDFTRCCPLIKPTWRSSSRVALWQIGPAADGSRNNLLVDASARENVSASSEGAQALAATAASLAAATTRARSRRRFRTFGRRPRAASGGGSTL